MEAVTCTSKMDTLVSIDTRYPNRSMHINSTKMKLLGVARMQDLFLPIVLLQAFAVASGVVGCDESLICNCIAGDFAARGPYVIGFSFFSILLEYTFAENGLSWLAFPFLAATFATANKDLPYWVWAHPWSLHVWLVVVGATIDGVVAVYRCLQDGNRMSAVIASSLLFSYGFVEILRRTAGDTVWLKHMQGLVSATAFLTTRVVAAATIHRRWRTSGEKIPVSVVPFLGISPYPSDNSLKS